MQSSTATALIAASFAKKQVLTLTGALAVLIGADISTTLVAQILSFDLGWLAPALLIFGVGGSMIFKESGTPKHIMKGVVGLALMLLALSLIRQAATPIANAHLLPDILASLQNDPILAIGIAAILTWIINSSLASVLLFASIAASGAISPSLALLLVLGANIGGAFVPFTLTYKDGTISRQITFGNIIMRAATLIILLPFLPLIQNHIDILGADIDRQIVNFHTGFNLVLAIIFLPLISVVAKICEKTFKHQPAENKEFTQLYLDEKALDSPVIALSGASRETLRMAEYVEDMFIRTMMVFESPDINRIKTIRAEDHKVDTLYKDLKLYMTRLSQEGLDKKDADRYMQILTFATNLEHIGDIIDKSLMDLAEKKVSKDKKFSTEGMEEIKNFHRDVLQNIKLAQSIFVSGDEKLAKTLIENKEHIRIHAEQMIESHFQRFQDRKSETLETSAIYIDVIRDFRRINSYITRLAFSVLENVESKNI